MYSQYFVKYYGVKRFYMAAMYSNILASFLGIAAEGKSHDQWLEKVEKAVMYIFPILMENIYM